MPTIKISMPPKLAFALLEGSLSVQPLIRIFDATYSTRLKNAERNLDDLQAGDAEQLLYEAIRQYLNTCNWSEFSVAERLEFITKTCSCFEFLYAIATTHRSGITDKMLIEATCSMLWSDTMSVDDNEVVAVFEFAMNSYAQSAHAFVRMLANLEYTNLSVGLGVSTNHFSHSDLTTVCQTSEDDRIRIKSAKLMGAIDQHYAPSAS